MNRVIKFRGWDDHNNTWRYGSLINVHDNGNRCQIRSCELVDGKYHTYEVVPESVGQFLGLEDKNKTEIYEGDIVESHSGARYKIEYSNDDSACFYLSSKYEFYSQVRYYMYEIEFDLIVGNMYQNSELLTLK